MLTTHPTLPIDSDLSNTRMRWFTAYQQQDITTMADIESKDFFAVYFQNVETKADWHKNIQAICVENDSLLQLFNTKTPIKVRHDRMADTSPIITSYFKQNNQSILVKEMWQKVKNDWQISSLVINTTQNKPL
ncbi:hypothetical protein MOMA_03230 [Moraxella macacae 0408225]|uniref:DUF4440 domain-containing protein n=1 Tax=Moraxella macacae 0408225 TaxID=1230338 RepID=L2F8L0_9GAMM|nr:hypothetical protein [Moraxella macacae]ELA09382.1 hypothetical protein MOMA_03230 [Moraxella macacae 0408225]